MTTFKFKKSTANVNQTSVIEAGAYVAVVIQVANIGLQKFAPDDVPVAKMAVVFETASGEFVTKDMAYSDHPKSHCHALFVAAFPDLDDEECELDELLGKSVLIEVEVKNKKWPKVTEIMRLEEGFDPIDPKTELLMFDVEKMDNETYLKLHPDVRSWISKRIRHSQT